MKIEVNAHVKGEFGFVVRNINTGETRSVAGPSGNLLLDRYFQECLAPTMASSSFAGIALGTGNRTPSESDTSLQNFVYGKDPSVHSVGSPVIVTEQPESFTRVLVYRILGSAIAGHNISEVGLALSTTSSAPTSQTPLLCRALIVDGSGNPTSISVLSDEVLDITYRHTTYAINDSGTMLLDIDGDTESVGWSIKPVSMMHEQAWSTNIPTESSARYTLGCTFQAHTETITKQPSDVSVVGVGFTGSAELSGHPITTQSPRPQASSTFTSRFNNHYADGRGGYTLQISLTNGNFSGGGFDSAILWFKAGSSLATSNQVSNTALGTHLLTFDRRIPKTEESIFELDIVMTLKNGAP